jgi:hypothetical protein
MVTGEPDHEQCADESRGNAARQYKNFFHRVSPWLFCIPMRVKAVKMEQLTKGGPPGHGFWVFALELLRGTGCHANSISHLWFLKLRLANLLLRSIDIFISTTS